ncbi:MAG: hypothetical protein Q8P05_05180 [Candidatus Diapherotrites archaeon]|nr:hypothetical protein [Candidatus Diapherotrites archaeon]MDZ4256296.1 hypothetical protein [archaeon]
MRRKKLGTRRTWGNTSIAEVLGYHVNRVRGDHRILFLWVVEILLAVGLAASMAIYLDPDINVVPFPWNIIAFLIMLSIGIWLHTYTRPYRMARRVMYKRSRS